VKCWGGNGGLKKNKNRETRQLADKGGVRNTSEKKNIGGKRKNPEKGSEERVERGGLCKTGDRGENKETMGEVSKGRKKTITHREKKTGTLMKNYVRI